jgi:hypothetical protein
LQNAQGCGTRHNRPNQQRDTEFTHLHQIRRSAVNFESDAVRYTLVSSYALGD